MSVGPVAQISPRAATAPVSGSTILTVLPGNGLPLLPAISSSGESAGKQVVMVKVSVLP